MLTKEEKYKAHIDVSLKGAHSSSLSTCNFHKKLVIAGFKWNKILQIFHLSRFLIIILLDTYIVRGQDRKVCHLVHSTAWKNLDDKYIKILNYTTKQYLKKVPDEKVWEALCRKFGERGVQTLVEEIDNSFTSIGGNRPVITHGFNKKKHGNDSFQELKYVTDSLIWFDLTFTCLSYLSAIIWLIFSTSLTKSRADI